MTPSRQFLRSSVIALSVLSAVVTTGFADDRGVRRALIICGHPGDVEHQAIFSESINSIRQALVTRFGFDRESIRIQFGQIDVAAGSFDGLHGGATRDELRNAATELIESCSPEDSVWVIVMGHAHYDGRRSFLNLPGNDVHMHELAEMFDRLRCREQIFMVTTPASGFAIKPLARDGRIVISATEDDLELNETLFHSSLAKMLGEIELSEQYDADRDDLLSWFDLYIAVARDVAQRYVDEELIATEHALLDDNGDGRGSEVQLDFLTEQLGGRADTRRARPGIRPGRDGELAARSPLQIRPLKQR